MFSTVGYHLGMPDALSLRLATADEIAEALSFALRYQGRKRVNHAAWAGIGRRRLKEKSRPPKRPVS